ncbi:MAG TPA: hypothetical protein VFS47_06610 [Steroidobacteraceae bacterium]|jgi:hypothetical protein|nr:hypothetical protein [Steroidobacteraceae bacterium]
MRISFQLAMLVLAACFATNTLAGEIVVVVNPQSGVREMTRSQVADVFMARDRHLPTGVTALPLDMGMQSVERREFYQKLLRKTVPEINAYWARLLFSGRATPPQQVPDSSAALKAVAENKGAIAYLDKKDVDSRVRVVLELVD